MRAWWERYWRERDGWLWDLLRMQAFWWPVAFGVLAVMSLPVLAMGDPLWWQSLHWGLVGLGWSIVATAVVGAVELLFNLWQELLARRRRMDGGTAAFPTLREAVRREIDFERWCK